MSGTPDVRLDHVTKEFDETVAVNDLSLTIDRGSFFALLGPSGCGKTTTLRMLGGFEEPTAGTIYLGEQEVTGLPPYKRDVNTVFQSYALFPHLNVTENIGFGLRRSGLRGKEVTRRVEEILELVDLAGIGRRKPRQLSGGQQQRVALARALVNSPQVLLLDEPLGALDLKLRKQMQLELKRIQQDVGITFVHVTHDQEEAMTMADVIAVMHGGEIEQLGKPTELYERPSTAFVAGFLGTSNLLPGTVQGGPVKLADGTLVRAESNSMSGSVSVGVRPEKLRIGEDGGPNRLAGKVSQTAYIGVATQVIVETAAGDVTVFSPERRRGSFHPHRRIEVVVSSSPGATFVVERGESTSMTTPLTRRQLLQRGAAGATLLSLPALLAACGGSASSTGTAAADEVKTTLNFANWPLYIDYDEETKKYPTLDEFKAKTGITVNYIEDINDNAQYFGKIQGPLSQGRGIGRDIIVLPTTRASPAS